ncbi:C-type lectin domain family 6 member A-like isoform X3 [Grammomys surdaster]|uniref:C-type lectin domain family 6 member A-like isoform X3 n=1 Tax=Grammomys surdaster TaxID=491861 RepID=UPI00109F020F|nr:C-type lectin domain family 6 member A-like isoform X3 [Grammomys surdaster]
MVQERNLQGKGVCWSLRLWSAAVISILLLSTCFIAHCVVTYQFTMDKPNTRLSELHTYHSSFTCFSEGTMVSDKVWSCCPKDWKLLGSHCYLVPTVTSTDSAASWMKSEEKCSQMGAHLLVIHSQKEQDFITNILSTHAAYFIGLRDSGHRQWQWVDQTPYDESATFWHKGEPSSEDEKCVILNHRNDQWGWNDIPCNHKHKSVCQMKKIYL